MADSTVFLLLLLGVGVVVVLGLVAVSRRGSVAPTPDDARAARLTAIGMSVGMLLGGVLGAVVWLSTGQFVFWVVFVGAGMTVGMAAGRGVASRPG